MDYFSTMRNAGLTWNEPDNLFVSYWAVNVNIMLVELVLFVKVVPLSLELSIKSEISDTWK